MLTIFVRAGLLTVEKMTDYLSVIMMYSVFYGRARPYLCNF